MKLALGSDHAGFEAKQIVEEHLREKGYEVVDKGAFSSESVDYPDIAFSRSLSLLRLKRLMRGFCCAVRE